MKTQSDILSFGEEGVFSRATGPGGTHVEMPYSGIRTFYDDDHPIAVLYRDWLHDNGWRGAPAKMREVVGNRPAYFSIRIDSLYPAYAPGTGTPVVDGLSPNDIIQFLRGSVDMNFVGKDIVEVSPPYDHADATAVLGASLALEYIGARAEQPKAAA
ncbi:arginase family protein [Leisingera sp.]|uniref:arginase family protein n=1 Tax=Leisingera sp. TaxID=1879318 RepID=UPI002B27AE0F|nr:arginase family protein [Leisingera sp.]